MLLSSLTAVLVCGAAAAITPPALEEISVIASRIPTPLNRASVPVQVIERAAIDARQSGQTADLLRGAPGFAVSQSGGVGSVAEIRLRGAEANQLRVSIDGIDINDPALGSNVDFANLDLIGATRIEILPGAQSALWGSDALAGVINIETTPSAGVIRRNVAIEGGSDDTQRAALELADGRGDLRYALATRFSETAGTNTALQGGEDDGYQNATVHINAAYEGERGAVRVAAHAVNATSEYDPTPFPDFVPVDGDLKLRVRQQLGGITANYFVLPAWNQRVALTHYSAANDTFEAGSRSSAADGDKTRLTYESDLFFDGLGAAQRATLAYEYTVEGFSQRAAASPFGDPNQDQHSHTNSVVAEYAGEWDGAGITLSMRHDANSAFSDANSYRAALRIPIMAQATVAYISAGTGTKNPTFTERYGYSPDTFFGNAQLRPERSRSLAVAVAHRFNESFDVRVTGFRDDLHDEIDGFVFDPIQGGFTSRNADGDSHRDGVELALHFQPTAQTSAQIDFTYLRATEPAANGRQDELRRPSYSGRVVIDQAAFNDRAHFQFGVAYVGGHDDLDFGAFPARRVGLDAYTLLHCTARYQLNPRLELSGRIENISDENYQDVYGYRTPGRRGYVGLRMAL